VNLVVDAKERIDEPEYPQGKNVKVPKKTDYRWKYNPVFKNRMLVVVKKGA